jgi:hypothetical protein
MIAKRRRMSIYFEKAKGGYPGKIFFHRQLWIRCGKIYGWNA